VQRGNSFHAELVKIDRPILRIPSLAIHLDRDTGTKFEINKQDHLLPVISTAIKSTLGNDKDAKEPSPLLSLLAAELKCNVSDIKDLELSVFDTQKSVIGGIHQEFIFSPRLDNLMMSFCSIKGLLSALEDPKALEEEQNVWAVELFDNEEVGSETAHGAASPVTRELIKRITSSTSTNGSDELYEIAIRRSFFVSADMAHALTQITKESTKTNIDLKFTKDL